MKNIFIAFMLLLPLCSNAQLLDADALLDKVIAGMKADLPLQMDYSYSLYDGDEALVRDNGVMRLDVDRYSLLMGEMKVWCNGETQWSYMKEIDEVYITDASSDEAKSLSPLYVMENYRDFCSKSVDFEKGLAVLTMRATDGNAVEKVVLYIDSSCNRLKGMDVFMSAQGCIKVILDKYQIKCNFAQEVYECPVKEFETAEIIDMR